MIFLGFKSIFKRKRSQPHPKKETQYDSPLTAKALKDIFSNCADFQTRTISVGGSDTGLVTVCYLDGLVDGNFLSESVIRPLTDSGRLSGNDGAKNCIDMILNGAVYSNSASEKNTLNEVVEAIIKGFSAIVFDREGRAVVFETRSSQQRSISEPNVEKAVKGAKDAFIERIRTNSMLVRRKLRTPSLKIIRTVIGRRSDTEVDVVYLEGIANPEIIGKVLQKLKQIDIDGLIATGNLEEYLSDSPYSPFPQTMHTERPDRFAINLLEGRVGLLVDGLPLGFLVPCTLTEVMRVPEDRAQHFVAASILRILRYIAAVITVLAPALYVAITMYHQEMIPLKLLLSIIQSKQEVPFSTATEIIGMLIAFEILQEAGLRLPNPIGETVSIIGALIVGQSAVEAKVISPIAVIIVATAGITGYTMPSQDFASALRLWRFFLVLCALAGGLFGILAGVVLVIYHLCCIESFGISFLSPLADGGPMGLFNMVFRRPLTKDKHRPEDTNTIDKRNQK